MHGFRKWSCWMLKVHLSSQWPSFPSEDGKVLGGRGLPGWRNIATTWGNKLTHIVCISSISSSSTSANWSSGIFIWNLEECLEKRDGGGPSPCLILLLTVDCSNPSGRAGNRLPPPLSLVHIRPTSSTRGMLMITAPFTQGQLLPSLSLCSLFSQETRMSTWGQWGCLKCHFEKVSQRKSGDRKTWKSAWWAPQHDASSVWRMLPVVILTRNA